jgi:hypothetical protein
MTNPFDRSLERQVQKEHSMQRPKDSRRDVMIHAAVTITPHREGIQVVGEAENEICQFRCDFPYKAVPINEDNVRRHFSAMAEKCLIRMKVYGLLK